MGMSFVFMVITLYLSAWRRAKVRLDHFGLVDLVFSRIVGFIGFWNDYSSGFFSTAPVSALVTWPAYLAR
jgi:hypothetical protein